MTALLYFPLLILVSVFLGCAKEGQPRPGIPSQSECQFGLCGKLFWEILYLYNRVKPQLTVQEMLHLSSTQA